MATPSLLKLKLEQVLQKAERLSKTKLPRDVVEVTLEPKLNTLCIRFKKPTKAELAEPAHPQIHIYREKSTNKVTAVEVLDVHELALGT